MYLVVIYYSYSFGISVFVILLFFKVLLNDEVHPNETLRSFLNFLLHRLRRRRLLLHPLQFLHPQLRRLSTQANHRQRFPPIKLVPLLCPPQRPQRPPRPLVVVVASEGLVVVRALAAVVVLASVFVVALMPVVAELVFAVVEASPFFDVQVVAAKLVVVALTPVAVVALKPVAVVFRVHFLLLLRCLLRPALLVPKLVDVAARALVTAVVVVEVDVDFVDGDDVARFAVDFVDDDVLLPRLL